MALNSTDNRFMVNPATGRVMLVPNPSQQMAQGIASDVHLQPTRQYYPSGQQVQQPAPVQAVIPNSGGVIASSATQSQAPVAQTPTQFSAQSTSPTDLPTTGTIGPNSGWGVYKGNGILNGGRDIKGSPAWYNDVIEVARPDLAGDPEQVAYEYAKSKGYGQNIEGQMNRYADPYAMSLIQNADLSTETQRLNYYGGFYDQATQNSGSQGLFNPRNILSRIMSAKSEYDTTGTGQIDQLGTLLYGGSNAQNPSSQVQAVMSMAKSALTGIMPNEILQNYLSVLAREGREYLSTMMKNPQETRNFGQWVTARLGPNAGF